jgi:general secretion pathway protein E
VIGVLAQRLVRRLCPACKSPDDAAAADRLRHLLVRGGAVIRAEEVRPYRAVGCIDCRMSGYQGRVGLVELMEPGQPYARLRQIGLGRVLEGLTSLDEVLRATTEPH